MARGRAWRRSKDATKARKQSHIEQIRSDRARSASVWPAEKSWKDLTTRSQKILRGRQLGFDYPRKTNRQLLDELTDAPRDPADG